MRTLLGVVIVAIGFIVTASLNLGIAPGLSVKNLFTYLPISVLVLNAIMIGQPLKLEHRAINAWFALLLGYALVTTVIAALVIKYPNYELLVNILDLKANVFDWWIIFVAFSQCPRTAQDVDSLIRTLLIVVSVANALTIGQALGALNLGRDIMCNEDLGVRICGVFGHANETAAFVAALLPAYIAVAESSAGARRLFWIGCMAPTATMLILTSSRGAIVGLVAGSLWAGVLCRRYLSAQRFVSWLSVTAATMVPMLLLVGWKYWHLMLGRWTEGTSVSAYSMTSGRSDIWQGYLMKMLQFPWTFITGFGWNAHSVMSFTYVPHNQYLTLWFTIGLVGIIGFIAIFRKVVTTAMAAARAAIPQSDARRQIVAGIFGTLILGVAVFFGTMYIIWQFWWIYAGLVMRYSVLVLEARSRLPANHPRELATRRSTLTAAQPASRRGM